MLRAGTLRAGMLRTGSLLPASLRLVCPAESSPGGPECLLRAGSVCTRRLLRLGANRTNSHYGNKSGPLPIGGGPLDSFLSVFLGWEFTPAADYSG